MGEIRRQGQGRGAGYQCDRRAPEHTVFCNGIAHLSGGMVADETNGINGFQRGACCYKDVQAGHIFGESDGPLQCLEQCFRFGHFAVSRISTGQIAGGGGDDFHTIVPAFVQIILHDPVAVHAGVHGGSHDFGTFAGKESGGQHVVGNAAGDLADDIGRGRSQQKDVRLFGQRDMFHLEFKIPVESVNQAFVAGQCFQGNGRYKVGGVFCHDNGDIAAAFFQHTCQCGNFVGGNAAGYAENDLFASKHMILSCYKCYKFDTLLPGAGLLISKTLAAARAFVITATSSVAQMASGIPEAVTVPMTRPKTAVTATSLACAYCCASRK